MRKRNKAEDWSRPEKDILRTIVKESDRLPYSLVNVPLANGGTERIYDIPADKVLETVRSLWPFDAIPEDDDVLVDIHSGNRLMLKDMKVARISRRSIVVCASYAEHGGTVLDVVPLSAAPAACSREAVLSAKTVAGASAVSVLRIGGVR